MFTGNSSEVYDIYVDGDKGHFSFDGLAFNNIKAVDYQKLSKYIKV